MPKINQGHYMFSVQHRKMLPKLLEKKMEPENLDLGPFIII